MSLETQDMADVSEVPEDPQDAYDEASRRLERHNVVIRQKGEGDPTAMFTTTLPGKIFLSSWFDEMDIRLQAATLWHELVHVKQWERMGQDVFVQHYAFTEGRWALEVPAYRQDLRILRHFGVSTEILDDYADERFLDLYEGYGLGTMPKECAEKLSFEAWKLELTR